MLVKWFIAEGLILCLRTGVEWYNKTWVSERSCTFRVAMASFIQWRPTQKLSCTFNWRLQLRAGEVRWTIPSCRESGRNKTPSSTKKVCQSAQNRCRVRLIKWAAVHKGFCLSGRKVHSCFLQKISMASFLECVAVRVSQKPVLTFVIRQGKKEPNATA